MKLTGDDFDGDDIHDGDDDDYGVLLDVLDEADQGRLVDPPVLEVVLLLSKHPLACTMATNQFRSKALRKQQITITAFIRHQIPQAKAAT